MGAMKIVFSAAAVLSMCAVGLGFLIADAGMSNGHQSDVTDGQSMVQGGGLCAVAFAVLAVAMAISEAAQKRELRERYRLQPVPAPGQYPPPAGYPR
jgi:hypothetical protein